ncbi:metastasis-associated protein MTA3-like [Oppia nitens]|uniref:metastasis-associated protein MTA3-like n=1 Tax=Oppia nitens TaxID=1686743 RepID=UPI0023DA3588|nr:metastasis-associated protein MTA3-like [Oppia nitens]
MSDLMANNMYRVGDYVYIETSSTSPYLIRRIEELIKTPNGNVEAKCMCFYRRRDISGSLIVLADKHQSALEEEQEREAEQLSEKHKHQLKLRELFLSRQVETLPATHIRGKCNVTLLNETESLASYINKEDAFFYTLVYDPNQKTLLADRGEIRVGQRYQAEVPTSPLGPDESDNRKLEELETLVHTPEHNLTDKQIDQFLIIARSVGTFARALDCSSSIKQPSLHMSAAAASRDITLLHAMQLLHQHGYNIGKALCSLVPNNGPVLCRDEMEEWSASEANLFEEALEKYGKDFNDIRQDFLPWKSLKNLVEYYYMWKTTDRYVQQKRVKAVEAESKLKQVYIPNYNNKQSNTMNGGMNLSNDVNGANGRACESCGKQTSSQWYAWGPSHLQCRLCQNCYTYWKKFGGLKYSSRIDIDKLNATQKAPQDSQNSQYPCRECNKVFNRQERLASHMASHRPHRCSINNCGKEFKFKAHLIRHCATSHGLAVRSGSPRPIMKTRAAFYLCATLAARVARRICSNILRSRHASRNPFLPINITAIRAECQAKFANGIPPKPKTRPIERGKVVDISQRLGTPQMVTPQWLIATPKDQLPQPERLAFIPPPRGPDGQLILPRPLPAPQTPEIENVKNQWSVNNLSPIMPRKRPMEINGSPVPPLKRRQLAPPSILGKAVPDFYGMTNRNPLISSLNGRAKVATITRVGGRKQMISWVDAPDDVYFVATDSTRKLRRQLNPGELRRAARRPWRRCGKSLHSTNNTATNNNNNSVNTNTNTLNLANNVPLFTNPVSIA